MDLQIHLSLPSQALLQLVALVLAGIAARKRKGRK